MGESRFTSEKSATRAIDSLIPRGARWNGTALPCRASPWKVQDNYRAALRAYYYQEAYDIASRGADSRHHRMGDQRITHVFLSNGRVYAEHAEQASRRVRNSADYGPKATIGKVLPSAWRKKVEGPLGTGGEVTGELK